eukprot:1134179-Pelagomonas_calceolata.AAC.7
MHATRLYFLLLLVGKCSGAGVHELQAAAAVRSPQQGRHGDDQGGLSQAKSELGGEDLLVDRTQKKDVGKYVHEVEMQNHV